MLFFSALRLSLGLAILCNAQMQVPNSSAFQVGVILDLDTVVGRIGLSSLSLAHSDFYSVNTNYTTKLELHVKDSKGQVIDAAAAALDLLKDVQVDVIIGPQKSAQASFVIDLGDKANVPIISFSATSLALHSRPRYFVQAAVRDSAQVDAIAAIVEHFQWRQVVLLYEDTDYGNGMIPYLFYALQKVNARVPYRSIIPLSATDDFLLQELYKMKTMQTRIFVVHVSSSLGYRLFPKAKEAGMLVEGYAWIATSGLMDLLFSLDPTVVEAMQGVLGVKPWIPRSSKLSSTAARWKTKFFPDDHNMSQAELSLHGLWAYDALWALAMAAERVRFRDLNPSSSQNTSFSNSTNLFFSTEVSQTGPKLLEAMSDVTFEGLSGNFRLANGQLEPKSFQILNVVGKGEREVGIWTPKGKISKSSKLNSIIFPGDTTVVPKGWEVPVSGKKLVIGVPAEPGFPGFVIVGKNLQTNALNVTGCHIDAFEAVLKRLPYAVPHEFVPFAKPDGSSAGNYNELVQQVSLKKYDAAVGDITITSRRSEFVDFTLPFSVGGVEIIVPITYDDQNNEWVFLRPLRKELWLTAIALFFLTGLALWILEHRFNSAYRGPPAHHAGMIFYFPFMSLTFAQRERIVTNLGRLVVIVWMFVVLILNSTYTASLSARLTIQRIQPAVKDVHELVKKGDYVGCHKGSFIVKLLQNQGFNSSQIKTYKNPEDCDEALSKGSGKGGISALFAVGPFTKLFLDKYCNKYTTVGPIYPTEGFAYAFPKGSPLVADVSSAIIELREQGTISEIERQCSTDPPCDRPNDKITSTSVPLQSFAALFGITGGITVTCLVAFLVVYFYKNRDFVQRISSSSTTTWSKIRAILRHFDQRDSKSFKAKEGGENTLPNFCADGPRSRTVVPISSEETGDIELSLSPASEQTAATNQRTSPPHHENTANLM